MKQNFTGFNLCCGFWCQECDGNKITNNTQSILSLITKIIQHSFSRTVEVVPIVRVGGVAAAASIVCVCIYSAETSISRI